jgi:hypothetical protein
VLLSREPAGGSQTSLIDGTDRTPGPGASHA